MGTISICRTTENHRTQYNTIALKIRSCKKVHILHQPIREGFKYCLADFFHQRGNPAHRRQIKICLKNMAELGGTPPYRKFVVRFPNWHASGCHFQEQVGWGTRLEIWPLWLQVPSKILPAWAKMDVFASNSLKNGAVNVPKRLKIDQKGLKLG